MKRRQRTPCLTRRKTIIFGLASLGFTVILTLAAAEFLARLIGIRPWTNEDLGIHVAPGGRLFTPHPALGYAQLPGSFVVTLRDGYSFALTHLPSGHRITHPLATYTHTRSKPEIWIFGCSFTHGWSLQDQETYPWLLQARLPDHEVLNYGVEGYGTLHVLIQLWEALATQPPPHLVIYAYTSLHDERNTFLRKRRKYVAPWNRLGPLGQPYARLTPDGTLHYGFAPVAFTPWPLMSTSALVHFGEMLYDQLEDRWARSHEVSKRLLLEVAALTQRTQSQFLLATIAEDASSRKMLAFARSKGLMAVDISVDSSRPEYRNLPHDSHPSPLANVSYAEGLESFVRIGILQKNGVPADPVP